jgi:hypothetical protein
MLPIVTALFQLDHPELVAGFRFFFEPWSMGSGGGLQGTSQTSSNYFPIKQHPFLKLVATYNCCLSSASPREPLSRQILAIGMTLV